MPAFVRSQKRLAKQHQMDMDPNEDFNVKR